MAPKHQLTHLLSAALSSVAPMSAAAAQLAFAQAHAMSRENVAALYSRPELNADRAAHLWKKYAPGTANSDGNGRTISCAWHGRALMRPESNPHNLTLTDVNHWPVGVAYEVSNLGRTSPGTVPAQVLVHLMSRPELTVALSAATSCPSHQQARNIITKVGAVGADAWPGLLLPDPSKPNLNGPPTRTRTGTRSRGEHRTIRAAIDVLARAGTPPELVEFAALTWVSPACLSALPTNKLSAGAAGRISRLWLIPAIGSTDVQLHALAKASTNIVSSLTVPDATALAGAWMGSRLLDVLGGDEAALLAAFETAGVPLIRPVCDEPAWALKTTNVTRRLELFCAIERAAENNPSLWRALEHALSGPNTPECTWVELISALTAAGAPRPASPSV